MQDHSILSALVSAVLDAARAIGLDADAIAAEAGIDPAWLADPDSRVPLEHDIRLWEVISRQPVGLELGAELGLHGLGVVGYAMRHHGTVGEAFAWQQRYKALVHPDVLPHMERRSGPAADRVVFTHAAPPPFQRLREPIDAYAASIVSTLQGLSGRSLRAAFVTLPLSRPADPSRHETFFACPVAWDGPQIEVAFDAGVLDLPLPRSDPHLFGYLSRRADQLLAALPTSATLADRVRQAIGAALARGEPRLGSVARDMVMSGRTLQRRLTDEGTRFADLVDAARRERAMLLLEDASISCTEIAFLLGYTEAAPFFRAFKRWTGMPPQAYRTRKGRRRAADERRWHS